MARKKKEWTADEMKGLLGRLIEHKKKLATKINAIAGTADTDFDIAVDLRNTAQFLVSTLLAIDNLTTLIIPAVERSGPRPLHIRLDDCGLDDDTAPGG